jgi:hypothetical protein
VLKGEQVMSEGVALPFSFSGVFGAENLLQPG